MRVIWPMPKAAAAETAAAVALPLSLLPPLSSVGRRATPGLLSRVTPGLLRCATPAGLSACRSQTWVQFLSTLTGVLQNSGR